MFQNIIGRTPGPKTAEPKSVIDKKLKCQFELPAESTISEAAPAVSPTSATASPPAATPVTPPQIDQTFVRVFFVY